MRHEFSESVSEPVRSPAADTPVNAPAGTEPGHPRERRKRSKGVQPGREQLRPASGRERPDGVARDQRRCGVQDGQRVRYHAAPDKTGSGLWKPGNKDQTIGGYDQ